jgi:hypothetical protein
MLIRNCNDPTAGARFPEQPSKACPNAILDGVAEQQHFVPIWVDSGLRVQLVSDAEDFEASVLQNSFA